MKSVRNILLSVAVLLPFFEASGQELPDTLSAKAPSDTAVIVPANDAADGEYLGSDPNRASVPQGDEEEVILLTDSTFSAEAYPSDTFYMKHSPAKAAIMSAVVPGLGQIYNKKWWKVPIVYVALGVSVERLVAFQNKYQQFRRAYIDMKDGDPYTNYHVKLGESFGTGINVESTITSGKDVLRRYRDWAIIAVVASYGLTIIDANVDAHLLDFNVDDDLSLHIEPVFLNDSMYSRKIGLNLRFTF